VINTDTVSNELARILLTVCKRTPKTSPVKNAK